jgi:hypothetical protein
MEYTPSDCIYAVGVGMAECGHKHVDDIAAGSVRMEVQRLDRLVQASHLRSRKSSQEPRKAALVAEHQRSAAAGNLGASRLAAGLAPALDLEGLDELEG